MIKTRILLIVLISLVFIKVDAQNFEDHNTHHNKFEHQDYLKAINSSEKEPQVGILLKNADVQANTLTGELNVNIPIYTLRSGQIIIPIGLSYSSDNDDGEGISDQLGEDWRISTNYSITRKVNGYPDDSSDEHGYFYNFDKIAEVRDNYQNKEYIANRLNEYKDMDLSADKYYYSLPNRNGGSFYVDRDGSIIISKGDNVSIEVFPKTNPKLLTYFTVTTLDGVKYTFGDSEWAVQYSTNTNYNKQYTRENKFWQVRGIGYAVRADSKTGYVGYFPHYDVDVFHGIDVTEKEKTIKRHKTNWFLTKIEDLNGNTVVFNYKHEKQNVLYYHSSNIDVLSSGNLRFCYDDEYEKLTFIPSAYGAPRVSFRLTQSKVESEIPSLESVVTNTHKIELITKRNRLDLKGADRLEQIKVSIKNGGYYNTLKKYELKYENKLTNSDCNFSYNLFYRNKSNFYKECPGTNIGNPFYHSESVGQEKNRLFLVKLTEIASNGNKIPSYVFRYENNTVEKQNPYPIIKSTVAPDYLYDDGQKEDGSENDYEGCFAVKLGSYGYEPDGYTTYWPQSGGPRVCNYNMPFVQMLNYSDTEPGSGNMNTIILPTGSEKVIGWENNTVSEIITKDIFEKRTLLSEKYDYKWAKAQIKPFKSFLLGKNSVKYIKLVYDLNRNGFDAYPDDHKMKEFRGYNRSWSVKNLIREFGSSKRASKKTNYYKLDLNKDTISKVSYRYNIYSNGVISGIKYLTEVPKGSYDAYSDPIKYSSESRHRHGLLDSVIYYDGHRRKVRATSYAYELFMINQSSMSSFSLSSDKSKVFELNNFRINKEFEYYQSSSFGLSPHFIRKVSEVNEEVFYYESKSNTISSTTEFNYYSDEASKYINQPINTITTFPDNSKLIKEIKYVREFDRLGVSINQAACDHCFQEHIECMRKCNFTGDKESLSDERELSLNEERLIEPIEGNLECEKFCEEALQRCISSCENSGSTAFTMAVRELYKKKAYGLPLETLTWKEANGIKTLISAELTKYKLYDNDISRPNEYLKFPNPGSITSFDRLSTVDNNLDYDSRYDVVGIIDRYDQYGNVEEYHSKNGKHVCNIYTHYGTLPAMQVENITYSKLQTAFGYSNLTNLKNSYGSTSYVNQYKNMLNHSYLKNSLASFNDYNTKGQLVSQYDGNGNKKSYEYDEFGRLKREKDNKGYLINEYKYNYSNKIVLDTDPLTVNTYVQMTDQNGRVTNEPLNLYGYRKFIFNISKGTGNYSVKCDVTCIASNGQTHNDSRTYSVVGNQFEYFPLLPYFEESGNMEYRITFTVSDGVESKTSHYNYEIRNNGGQL